MRRIFPGALAAGVMLAGILLVAPGMANASTTECHPNYVGACLPIRGDVDCYEIKDRNFRVKPGKLDVYGLDKDRDGIACEGKGSGNHSPKPPTSPTPSPTVSHSAPPDRPSSPPSTTPAGAQLPVTGGGPNGWTIGIASALVGLVLLFGGGLWRRRRTRFVLPDSRQ